MLRNTNVIIPGNNQAKLYELNGIYFKKGVFTPIKFKEINKSEMLKSITIITTPRKTNGFINFSGMQFKIISVIVMGYISIKAGTATAMI